MSLLFNPLEIGSLCLQNRIIIPPMCQYSAIEGKATDWHLLHFGNMTLSGAGLFIIEATAVEPRGRISPFDLGLWSDDTEAALDGVLRKARQFSKMPVAIQLAHAGRKASTAKPWQGGKWLPPSEGGWVPVAPSPIPFAESDPPPTELTSKDIADIVRSFVLAAERAHRIGVDLIELHAAHGYLLHEFLSPLSNQRVDAYGGPLENRMRLTLEVLSALRNALPESVPIGVRISATDWVEGGWNLPESIVLAERLKALGAVYIHVSSGGLSPRQKIPLARGYQVPFSGEIRKQAGIPTIAVGLIETAEQAEAIVQEQQADMVGIARAMIFDPRWPWHAAEKLKVAIKVPPPYWRCVPNESSALFSPDIDIAP